MVEVRPPEWYAETYFSLSAPAARDIMPCASKGDSGVEFLEIIDINVDRRDRKGKRECARRDVFQN